MLTGSQIKSLLESDLQAGNITINTVLTQEVRFALVVFDIVAGVVLSCAYIVLLGGSFLTHSKQGSINFQELHPPTFITSNLVDKSTFIKSRKEMGSSCQITSDDYLKIFSLSEGRIGTEVELRHAIPRIWQRKFKCCRRCSARFIRWLLGIHVLPSKAAKYEPPDFYNDSDKDSENESATYTSTIKITTH